MNKILCYLTVLYFVVLTTGCAFHYNYYTPTNPNVEEAIPPAILGAWTARV